MNPLKEIITAEVSKSGILPFARFMELALYCPVYGYYETEDDIVGRKGDFFTNVSVGSLFGELLAFQLCKWFEGLEFGARADEKKFNPLPPVIIEAGAHQGQLARDVLGWFQRNRPQMFGHLEYIIVEISERRRASQENLLYGLGSKIHWMKNLAAVEKDPRLAGFQGIILSNELLDAMPAHRIGWDAKAKEWFEWGVILQNQEFTWAKIVSQDYRIRWPELPVELLQVLPDGFTTEICPQAESWWSRAAIILKRGRLVTLDYGLTFEERFLPGRTNGTLRAYYRHHVKGDLLARAGEQDITAHVDFTSVRLAGEKAGLNTDSFVTQENFLTRIAEQTWKSPETFDAWTPERIRQFQTLIHPEHLGRPFRVLVQSRPGNSEASS